MTSSISKPDRDFMQEIATLCYQAIPPDTENFLLFCTFHPGVVGPSLFYEKRSLFSSALYYTNLPDPGSDLLMDFWYAGLPEGRKEKWTIACMHVHQNRFRMDITYADEVPEEQLFDLDLRDKFIKRYFGKIKVIYPKHS